LPARLGAIAPAAPDPSGPGELASAPQAPGGSP
jgi:hypothetical protein